MPVTKETMKFVSVVVAGLLAFVVGLWFCTKRGNFIGPEVDFEEIRRRREEVLNGIE
jgi:hypothetical protein